MESNGRGPKPYAQHQFSTLFVRVAADDWPLVKRGHKREFRNLANRSQRFNKVQLPVPVVVYNVQRGMKRSMKRGDSMPATYDARLMLLEEHWTELLGAISDESLRREGYADISEFRRVWMRRYRDHQKFKPTRSVCVYRVRPWEPEDEARMGAAILQHLYGEWLS